MADNTFIIERVRQLAHDYQRPENVLADRVLAADDLIELLSLVWDK